MVDKTTINDKEFKEFKSRIQKLTDDIEDLPINNLIRRKDEIEILKHNFLCLRPPEDSINVGTVRKYLVGDNKKPLSEDAKNEVHILVRKEKDKIDREIRKQENKQNNKKFDMYSKLIPDNIVGLSFSIKFSNSILDLLF